jgi:NAD(P)-dependent dehydrogenase (short-subunit alcohol dehydrogenase family)
MQPHAFWSRSRTHGFIQRYSTLLCWILFKPSPARVKKRFPGESLDLLINNAGVMALPTREVTGDGFERQFATNYLGPFALTMLLLPSMKPVAGSRVVTVSSSASNQGKIEFDNLQSERVYTPMFQAYAQSKLADLIFSLELRHVIRLPKNCAGSPLYCP